MQNSDVLKWPAVVVDECCVDLLQSIKALNNLAEYGGLAVEVFDILAERDDELTACESIVGIDLADRGCHTNRTTLRVL